MGRDGELKSVVLDVGNEKEKSMFVLVGEPSFVTDAKVVGIVKVGVLPLKVIPLSVDIVELVFPELAYTKLNKIGRNKSIQE